MDRARNRLEKGKHHSCLHEGQGGGCRGLQAGQPCCSSQEDHGANPPGSYVQCVKAKKVVGIQPHRAYQEQIVPDQISCFLQWDLCGQERVVRDFREIFQRDLISLDTWTERALIKFSKDKCKVCSWGHGITLYHGASWVYTGWEEALQRRTWGSCGQKVEHQCAFAVKKSNGILGCIRQAGWRRWPFPSVQSWWDTSGVLCPVLGSQCKRDMDTHEWVQKRPPSWWGTGAHG